MADSEAQEDAAKVASYTLAFLRSLDPKMDPLSLISAKSRA
jgi:hypothetical protein